MMRSPVEFPHTLAALLAVTMLSVACRDTAAPLPSPANATEPAFAKRQQDAAGATLTLCKHTGAGITDGEPFAFRLTETGVVRVVTVAAGSCLNLEVPRESSPTGKGSYANTPASMDRLLPAGSKLVVDDAQLTSASLSAILTGTSGVTAPSALVLNLAQQLVTADLNVLRGVQPSDASAQAIADANAAITIDESTLAITTTLTAAGVSALVDALTAFNEGKTARPATPLTVDLAIIELTEGLSQVTSIECAPAGACTEFNVPIGSVTATAVSGATTTVTYTNQLRSGIRVCKIAGAGVDEGTVYDMPRCSAWARSPTPSMSPRGSAGARPPRSGHTSSRSRFRPTTPYRASRATRRSDAGRQSSLTA